MILLGILGKFACELLKIKDMLPIKLAIVAPCFNEEEVLPLSAERLHRVMTDMTAKGLITADSFVLFVNDGSSDRTWETISSLHARDAMFKGIDLSRNSGQQNALLAGMLAAVKAPFDADAVVTIDVDLQEPPEAIEQMVRYYGEGSDVVYGVRSARERDSFLKRYSAESFYRLQRKLGIETVFNHADFRLMTRRAILELERYTERNLYLRGIVPLIGYNTSIVEVERDERPAGESKYNLSRMMRLAFDGITSFSVTPMYLIMIIGFLFILIALGIGVYVLVSLLNGSAVHGWSSLILSIWLVGGFILLSVGLVGLYVGKVFIETKNRPRYHIRSILD